MFKKNISLIAVLALFTGCVQKNVENQTYDLSNHWFNMKDLSNNKIVINRNLTQQFNDGSETSKYTDYIVYKKAKELSQLEQYTFFEDINKQNYKNMLSHKSMDVKYNILENDIKETFLSENQTSIYKRNVKINDKVIEEKDMDGSVLSCTFSNYYEKLNVKDKINGFFSVKYFTEDRNYNNVIELQCKDSFVDGEYYIYMAKNIGTIFYMRKDMDDGSLEESFSIIEQQTILE
jgi:hypothetical protein